jgi:hypothetical protein
VAQNPLIDAPPKDIEPYWHDFSQAWQDKQTGRWWAFAGAGWRGRKQAPCSTCRTGAPVPLCSAPNGSFHTAGAWVCKPGDELWVATNSTAGVPGNVFAPHPGPWGAAAFSCPEFYTLPPPMPSHMRVFEGLLDDGKDHYWAGQYDSQARRFDPSGYSPLKYNWGAANAGKSFWHVESGRRLLWQWLDPMGVGGSGGCHVDLTAAELSGTSADPAGVILCPATKHAWDGVMSVPQEVRWDDDTARLMITPAIEIDQLRKQQLLASTVVLGKTKSKAALRTSSLVSMAHVDVVLQFNVSHSAAATDGNEDDTATAVGLRLFETVTIEIDLLNRVMCVNSTQKNVTAPLPLPQLSAQQEVIDLRILVDGEQLEVFGLGGRANVALRTRPDYNASDALGTVFARGLSEGGAAKVDVSAQMYSMETAYEDDEESRF